VLTLLPSESLAALRALAPDVPSPTLDLLLELALLWPRPEAELLALALALPLSALALALELSATAGSIGSTHATKVSARVESNHDFMLVSSRRSYLPGSRVSTMRRSKPRGKAGTGSKSGTGHHRSDARRRCGHFGLR
jgi:hypothetical protein